METYSSGPGLSTIRTWSTVSEAAPPTVLGTTTPPAMLTKKMLLSLVTSLFSVSCRVALGRQEIHVSPIGSLTPQGTAETPC